MKNTSRLVKNARKQVAMLKRDLKEAKSYVMTEAQMKAEAKRDAAAAYRETMRNLREESSWAREEVRDTEKELKDAEADLRDIIAAGL